MNGQIVETNKTLILAPLHVLDKITEWNMIALFDYYMYCMRSINVWICSFNLMMKIDCKIQKYIFINTYIFYLNWLT